MHCPFCNAADTKVIDSRLVGEGHQVRRRRQCQQCQERFTTFEQAELRMPRVVKSNGTREPYNPEKPRRGMLRALEKRPIDTEQVELVLRRLQSWLRALGEREVSSKRIGQWVMDELRELDEIAYIRFASVYMSFDDLRQFGEEIAKLGQGSKK